MRGDLRRAVAALPLAALVLLSGCASMPSSGSVDEVSEPPRTESDSQVRVFGARPEKGDSAIQVVRGFLEAITSDEGDFDTARLYLTKKQRREWDPGAGITVLASSPTLVSPARRQEHLGSRTEVDLAGQRAAWVDRHHTYRARQGEHNVAFSLIKEKSQWRIDELPDGLVLGKADFERMYDSVNMYYYAAPGPDQGPNILVPDPVYLRQRVEPVTSAVKALLDGPTDWLVPSVVSSFPRGTTLSGEVVKIEDSERRLRVPLVIPGKTTDRQCRRMATQLMGTMRDHTAAKIDVVELRDVDGSASCTVSRDEVAAYDPLRPTEAAVGQFFIDPEYRLVSLGDHDVQASPVAGPFGEGQVQLGNVAVRLDGRGAAGVRRDGAALYVADFQAGTGATSVLTSTAQRPEDRLSAPSWDGWGDLWVADRDPQRPRLIVLRGDQVIPVDVPDLAGRRVQSLRVAADGVRIALVLRDGDRTTLELGRVERGGTERAPRVSVRDLRPVAPQLEDIAAVSWAGQSRILVVGRESQGVQQLKYVDTDGSTSYTPMLPAISGVTAVAAPPDRNRPLLADSEEGMFRLGPDSNWKRVQPKEGTSPVYPG